MNRRHCDMYSRIVGVAALLALLALLSAALPAAAASGRPNVLLIYVDDLNCRLGTYGDRVAQTPHLDALARAGLRLDRAYSANPVCMPSRTALLTALRSDTTKTPDNTAGCFRQHVPAAVTLPQHFAAGGYTLTAVGKTFFSHGSDDPETWKVLTRLPPLPPQQTPPDYIERMLITDRERSTLRQMLGKKQIYWGPIEGEDASIFDGQAALAAARFLKENRSQPFFLTVGFLRPHLPFIVPKKYFDLYPLDSLPEPAATQEHLQAVEEVELGLTQAANRLERERNTGRLKIGGDVARRIRQAYYASVSYVDAQIGIVLQALREAGHRTDTIVVLVSDHGFLLGEHGCWAKSSLYEESIRAPLIISAPGVTKPGSTSARLVEHVDLYPTLAGLCGLAVPQNLEGISLVPLLREPERAWKRAAFSSDMCGERMVRTEKWKLIQFPEDSPQGVRGLLFDVERDPPENNNLFQSPAHRSVLDELTKLLAQGWKAALP